MRVSNLKIGQILINEGDITESKQFENRTDSYQ